MSELHAANPSPIAVAHAPTVAVDPTVIDLALIDPPQPEPQLREYQIASRDWMIAKHRGILALDMGLGKTPTTIAALRHLNPGTTLIAPCVKVAVGVWESELPRWWPEVAGRVFTWMGGPAEREAIWREFMAAPEPKVLITNAHKLDFLMHIADYKLSASWRLAADRRRKARQSPPPVPRNLFAADAADRHQARHWGAVVVDEAHFMRNKDTQLFRNAAQLLADNVFLLTGSPMVKNAGDLWTLLHLVAPNKPEFRAYWPFVERWCQVDRTMYGMKIGGPLNGTEYRAMLKPHTLILKKGEVLKELPPKIRQMISVPLLPAQRRLYNSLSKDMMALLAPDPETGERKLLMLHAEVAKIVRLRQTIVNPALFGDVDESAHLEALEELVGLEFDAGNHVAVFTPFVQAMPMIAKRLERAGANVITQIRGGMTADQLTRTIREFQESELPNRSLICSILAGSAWTGTAASVAYFVGFEWLPAHNIQAEDRLHRFGQRDTVRIGYLRAVDTLEDHIIDVLNERTTWEALALDPARLLRGSAAELTPRTKKTDLAKVWKH